MADDLIIPPIPATSPEVVPAVPQKVFGSWFPIRINIEWKGENRYDAETFFQRCNDTEVGTEIRNCVIQDILAGTTIAEIPEIGQAAPALVAAVVSAGYRKGIL